MRETIPAATGQSVPPDERNLFMEWDLGFRGIGVLLAMSLVAGLIAQLIMWRVTTHRLWILVAATYFVSGLFISEVLFGWATEEDLQPNIDGLSFDEVLLIGFIPVFLVMLMAWIVRRRDRSDASRMQAGPHAT